tara:strand:+ start:667 stop:2208 length:1542 start_codon:yes stop_codon:yes gene_type:complete
MRVALFILFIALFMAGCEEPPKLSEAVVEMSDLQERNGVHFLHNEETPYTGLAEQFNANGQKYSKGNYKNGKQDGLWISYNIDGSELYRETYANGELSLFLPSQSGWTRSPASSDSVSITFENSFGRAVRVFWVDFAGVLKNYGTIPPHGDMSISTFVGHQWVLDFSPNDLTGIFTASSHESIANINTISRNIAMKLSTPPSIEDRTILNTGEESSSPNIDNSVERLASILDEILARKLDKDGKPHGLYTELYENGQIKFEINYKDGKKDGVYRRWYENGQKNIETPYKEGKVHGLWTEWYESGQKREEWEYKNGEVDGLWTQWYENGQKMLEIKYKDGEALSTSTQWYENGQKMLEKNSTDEQLIGLLETSVDIIQKKLAANSKDDEEYSAPFITDWDITSGNVNLVKTKLEAGADPNVKVYSHVSALHWACEKGQLEIASMLLSRGALCNTLNGARLSPLDLVIGPNKSGIAPLERMNNGTQSTLIKILEKNGAKTSKEMMKTRLSSKKEE